MKFTILLCAMTTEGHGLVETDPIEGWDETAAQLDGMIAAVGEDNVIYALIKSEVA